MNINKRTEIKRIQPNPQTGGRVEVVQGTEILATFRQEEGESFADLNARVEKDIELVRTRRHQEDFNEAVLAVQELGRQLDAFRYKTMSVDAMKQIQNDMNDLMEIASYSQRVLASFRGEL